MKYQKTQYVITSNNKIEENSIRWGKTRCIDDWVNSQPFYPTWKEAYGSGYRCVKIKIQIDKA